MTRTDRSCGDPEIRRVTEREGYRGERGKDRRSVKERVGHRSADDGYTHRRAHLMRKPLHAQKAADRDRRRQHMGRKTNSLSREDDESDRPCVASIIVDPNMCNVKRRAAN